MLNTELGILWDTLYFGRMYCYQEERIKFFEERSLPTDELIRDFEKLKREVGELPLYFRTLFFRLLHPEKWTGSLMSYIMDRGKPALTMEDFLSRLDSREFFFTCAAAFFFPKGTGAPATGLNEGDAAAWYRATGKEGELPEFVKTDMAYICGDFDSFQKEVQYYLTRIYRAVKAEHLSRREECERVAEAWRKRENVERINRRFKSSLTGEEIFENGTVVTILNPYCTAFFYDGEEDDPGKATTVLCGVRFEEGLISLYQESGNAFLDFVVACGADNKIRIVCALMEKEEMTSMQLSRELSVSAPMMGRYLADMQDAGIVYRSRREGKNIFYSLDREKMRQVKNAATVFLGNF